MEIFQQCLTELLRVVVLVIIAGFGVLARMYLVPLLKSWVEKAKSAADLAGIDLTAEQIEQAKEIIAAMVASAYRLKLGGKIEDAKTYVNELAKTELAKLSRCARIEPLFPELKWWQKIYLRIYERVWSVLWKAGIRPLR